MISKYKYKGLSWVHLESPSEAEVSMAWEDLGIDIALEEIIAQASIDHKLEGKSTLTSFVMPILVYSPEHNNVSQKEIYFISTPQSVVTIAHAPKGLFANVAKKIEKVAFANMENSLENPFLFISFLMENLIHENTTMLTKLNTQATRAHSRRVKILNTFIILLIIGIVSMFYFLK